MSFYLQVEHLGVTTADIRHDEISAAPRISKTFSGKMHYIADMSVTLYLELFLTSLPLLLSTMTLVHMPTQCHKA